MSHATTTVLSGGRFFEGPRWHMSKWYVSDFYRHVVMSIDRAGRSERVLEVPGQPSGLGWLADGSMLVVSMTDHRILRRWPDGTVTEHADISPWCGGWANDMVVDGRGRAYVGNFGYAFTRGSTPKPTVLVRVDPNGAVAVVADGLLFPNGSVISPDGRTLVVGETVGNRLTAFTILPDGSLAERRLWADLSGSSTEPKRFPDGCTLDAEGCVWLADPGSGECVRITATGAVVDRLEPPTGLHYFACALGDEDGRTLLACAVRSYREALESEALDAVCVTTRVDVPHAGWP